MRKRDIERPYPPAYVSADTLSYLLDLSRTTLDDYVRLGHLPPPETVGTQRRWDWHTVRTWIKARNGRLQAPANDDGDSPPPGVPGSGTDAFSQGIARATQGETADA